MNEILERSWWVFAAQVFLLLAGLAREWSPMTIFVATTMPVFGGIILRDSSNRCFGTIGLLAVAVASVFSWNDKLFLGIVTMTAVVVVSLLVSAFEAQDAKMFDRTEEPMWRLFLSGLPYGIGLVTWYFGRWTR
jgi:hypothetical protein